MHSNFRRPSPHADAVMQGLALLHRLGHKAAWEFLCQQHVPAAVMLRVLSRQGPRRCGDSGVEPSIPASMPHTFRGLPLLRGQQAAVLRFLAASQQRGETADPEELSRMLDDMLNPPPLDGDDRDDGAEPPERRAMAERASGWSQDGIDADSELEERLAAAEAEAMKRG